MLEKEDLMSNNSGLVFNVKLEIIAIIILEELFFGEEYPMM